MWILTIIAILASLTGYASMSSQIALAGVEDTARANALALNMASYRSGVVESANDSTYAGVNKVVVVNALPTGYAALNPAQWSNVVLADGTIAVYSVGVSPPGLIKGIATLAQGSVLAGRVNLVTNKIEAPGTISADQIDLGTILTNVAAISPPTSITDGAAIWLAHRN